MTLTEKTTTLAAPAVVSAAAIQTSIRIEPLTCTIGAALSNVNLGAASRDDAMVAEIRSLLLKHKVLFLQDQDLPGQSTLLSRAISVISRTIRWPAATLTIRGSCVSTRTSTARRNTTKTHGTAMPLGARSRHLVACCVASRHPRSVATRSGATWSLAYERLPEHIKAQIANLRARHSIEATFGAAMPIEKRLALKAQYPDAEHPVVRTHPETGEKILFVNAFTTHFTNFHTPENVRFGQDFAPGASQLLNYLISQAYVPEYQVRWRWRKNSVAIWDNRCTQHYAVQDYWPAVRKMERAGIKGDTPF